MNQPPLQRGDGPIVSSTFTFVGVPTVVFKFKHMYMYKVLLFRATIDSVLVLNVKFTRFVITLCSASI